MMDSPAKIFLLLKGQHVVIRKSEPPSTQTSLLHWQPEGAFVSFEAVAGLGVEAEASFGFWVLSELILLRIFSI